MNLSNHFFTQSSSAFRNGARFLPKMELEVQDEVFRVSETGSNGDEINGPGRVSTLLLFCLFDND
ncbi:hypothetical protein I3842_01G149000 [Carya illinoinensis]|uniref:Uncharacterized protein n=1 Tax=Carya illinoinensis TaxID=32201 RepID=A0A922G0I9_CARIL|nr:hypothetical protein I3842_01G149000 [Carya illinoinensis]